MSAPATAAPARSAFLREKFIEFGGPNGGNGGRGGDVVVECVDGLNTLIDYRYQQHFKAATGTHGMGKDRHGAKGKDVMLRVPVGTQIFEDDNETLIADFTQVGQTVTLLSGGNGGFGNAHFKTSANQAPRHANPGQEGDGEVDLAAAEADRRRRAGRPAQRRQVDFPRGRLGGQAQDRRLSVHDAPSQPRRGAASASAISCSPTSRA